MQLHISLAQKGVLFGTDVIESEAEPVRHLHQEYICF